MDQQIIKGLEKLGADSTGRAYVNRFENWDAFWVGNENTSYLSWLIGNPRATSAKEILAGCIGFAERALTYAQAEPSSAHAVVAKAKELLKDFEQHLGKSTETMREIGRIAGELATNTGNQVQNSVHNVIKLLASHIANELPAGNRPGSSGNLFSMHTAVADLGRVARGAGHPQADLLTPVALMGDLRKHIDRVAIEQAILKAAGPAPSPARSGCGG